MLFNRTLLVIKPKLIDILQYSTTLFERELLVPTFCDVVVKVPFHIHIKPLDVHKYHNCDQLLIKIEKEDRDGKTKSQKANEVKNRIECIENSYPIECIQHGNHIEVKSESDVHEENLRCLIKAPVKSNVYIESQKGDVILGAFNGDKIKASTKYGNIFLKKFQGDKLILKTDHGNITINGAVQVGKLELDVAETGSIDVDRLQSLDVEVRTKNGDISCKSSYCNKTHFEIHNGNLNLENVHQHCKVVLSENGNLKISGISAEFDIYQKSGTSDIQISKLLGHSNIRVEKPNEINLRLSEKSLESTKIAINCDELNVHEDMNIKVDSNKDNHSITPLKPNGKVLKVHCPRSKINLEGASWSDMLLKKMKNKQRS